MAKIVDFKNMFYFVLIYFCIDLISYAKCDSSQVDLSSFNFRQIKIDLFLQTKFSESNNLNDVSSLCATQLNEIKNGLKNSSDWALNLVNSWGEIPMTISSANSYEFGEFSQCFNIQRNGKHYETQYCLGQLVIEKDSDRASKFSKLTSLEYLLPLPEKGIADSFGLCLPNTCSLRGIEPILNELARRQLNSTSIKLYESTCQFREAATELESIDLIAIAFFGFILCLIISSTCYDIYTYNNQKRIQAFLAFSFFTNGMKLFSVQKQNSAGMIGCINGIRALSSIWVVLFHSVMVYKVVPIQNIQTYSTFNAEYHSMMIYSGRIAVDTFLVLSGLLITMSMLKSFEKNGRIDVTVLYLQRYIRLTPLLGVCILLLVSLFRFTGSGPLWDHMIDLQSSKCKNFWWAALLYVHNYVHPNEACYPVSWYLAVDMQLFIIAPAIVYLIYRFKAKAICGMALLILICIAGTLAVHLEYRLTTVDEKWATAYIVTHTRYSSWLIGVMAGYFLFKTRNQNVHIPKILNIFAWISSLASLAVVIFANYPLLQENSQSTPLEYGLYDALSRVIWSSALCYIIFACVHNSGGPVNWFLAHPFWQLISKLSYSIYLMHFFLILNTISIKSSVFFTESTAIHAFIVNLVITLFLSIFATLTFEEPMTSLAKIILTPTKKLDSNKNNNLEIPQEKYRKTECDA